MDDRDRAIEAITEGRTSLGIELGSTRIKACLIGEDHTPIATGSYEWENQFVDRLWTYSLDAIHAGLQAAYADLVAAVERTYGTRPTAYAGLGVSAMMHGYLAFDAAGDLLVPFRTWRNTNTAAAAAVLTELFGHNIPLRWSIAHHYQAVLDDEEHVGRVAALTTLAGYVHRRLTGQHVLGIGDAVGMFPIDDATRDYDETMIGAYDALVTDRLPGLSLRALLPAVRSAGEDAGTLTSEGAAFLDPTGTLRPGAPVAPPEGDAGTGMIATNAVAPRTGNVSVGTSIFAMVVLERALREVHPELDLVTTPAGDPVAMVHCNNGASELGAWAEVFGQFATALGHPASADDVFAAFLGAAPAADPDGGGLLAFNYLSGEPITGLEEGRPLVLRTPDSRLTLANFARTQVYSAFATLALGMEVLAGEGVGLDAMFAHGGLFRTEGVAQRLLAAAIDTPVSVGSSAAEGGAWGMAVLAAFRAAGGGDLAAYLERVFADAAAQVAAPDAEDRAGFERFLVRYRAALPVVAAAVEADTEENR